MDPQACLQRIIDIVKRDKPRTPEDTEYDWSEIAQVFDDLGTWLRGGGFPPIATGPIFGTTPVSVGYPGMTEKSPARYEQRLIQHVKSSRHPWRYAIMTVDPASDTCREWGMNEYDHRGTLVHVWKFPTEATHVDTRPTV